MGTKKVKDLVKGDVIKTEYGIEDNWVTVEILKVVRVGEGRTCRMHCRYLSGKKVDMYGNAEDTVELVEVK